MNTGIAAFRKSHYAISALVFLPLLLLLFCPGPAAAAVYRVKKGDTLTRIAGHNGVTVSQLKEWNGLKTDTVFIGQRLKIETNGEKAEPAGADDSSAPEYYTVKKGDTVAKIARKCKVSAGRLIAWNKIKKGFISPGQKLRLSAPEGTGTSVSQTKKSRGGYVTKRYYYRVKKGDSLGSIARKAHTTTRSLRRLNRLKSDTIYPGRRLLVRVRRVPRYGGHDGGEPDTPPLIEPKPIIEGDVTFHTVQEGETLESIAGRYGLSPEEIRSANLLPEGKGIKKGQVLAIPQTENTETDTGPT